MNGEREFWVQVRRGLLTVVAAIDDQHDPDPFWSEMRRGFTQMSRAIEYRWRLPVHSRVPIGAGRSVDPTNIDEPPVVPLARSSPEGIE